MSTSVSVSAITSASVASGSTAAAAAAAGSTSAAGSTAAAASRAASGLQRSKTAQASTSALASRAATAAASRAATAQSQSNVKNIARDLVKLSSSLSQNAEQSASFANASAAASQAAEAALSVGLNAQEASRVASAVAAKSLSNCGQSSGCTKAEELIYLSELEKLIRESAEPVAVNETEEIEVNGERGLWTNRAEVQGWKGDIPIDQYEINKDCNPEIITKRVPQSLEYIQELAVRYLRPPTPPPPGEILIQQQNNICTGPAPPLIIRQQPPRPCTPAPLVIREAPPNPPPCVGKKVITISGKRIPPPPRKVIIERLAPLPTKPQSVLIERWLPYAQVKRRVIFQGPTCECPVVCAPRNVIVQWESPNTNVRKDVKYLGVIRANPAEYVSQYGASLLQSSALPPVVNEVPTPDGLVLAADYQYNELHELEGDVQALKLINLDAEGLAAYQAFVASLPPGSSLAGRLSKAALTAASHSSVSAAASQAASASVEAAPAPSCH